MEESQPSFDTSPSLIRGHAPKESDVRFSIGRYQIIKSVGKGGMGEVLLAYDTVCGRRIALKRIREDLKQHSLLHDRFLKEARITCQLTHPAIMPIYDIRNEKGLVYYTMPFVQGETLKQILRQTREQEKNGEKLHHIGGSIPALVRIFITICQAIAYAHSKGVLHRDLKPENFMIGEYGEVLILDWGLAKLIASKESEDEELELRTSSPFHELTRPGKVVGTINYMPPERAMGNPATVQTEIYSLGVILYQILTLRNPFRRKSIEEFRKNAKKESVEDPTIIAPYRDVPHLLSRIAMKCLSEKAEDRYLSVDELLHELENYIEGRSEWFLAKELDIQQKEDWEFQENFLIAEHIAITRGAELTDWVSLMISKASFTENTKIQAEVTIEDDGYGIGFLLSIPEAAERVHLNDGYCLWIGSDINKSTKLLRSTVEVLEAGDVFLQRGKTYRLKIEKIDHNIYFYLNDTLQFSYISYLPLVGTHIGILSRDANFTISKLSVYVGNQNITVNCLAVPDAFLACKGYDKALIEYRRIGYSFPGRAEGREAMFRAGITILEQAKNCKNPELKEKLYDDALLEFEKLHTSPGAPLEYLGKAHVYRAMNDVEEEVKCYELCFRKYPNHPLLPVLYEQLIYRMHETARFHRKATYFFVLTALRHLPEETLSSHTKKLFESLLKHWEPLYFIENDPKKDEDARLKNLDFRMRLSFWLANLPALVEVFDEAAASSSIYSLTLSNTLFCMVELGAWKLACQKLKEAPTHIRKLKELKLIEIAIAAHKDFSGAVKKLFSEIEKPSFDKVEGRLFIYLIEMGIQKKMFSLVGKLQELSTRYEMQKEEKQRLDALWAWALLMDNKPEKSGVVLHRHPLSTLTKEKSLLFILYGCWLAWTESKEIAEIHFSAVLDVSYPRTWALACHFINGKISKRWTEDAFLWEKRLLYRQLVLFYHCIDNKEREKHFALLEKEQYISGTCLFSLTP